MRIFRYSSFEIKTDSTEWLLFAKVNIHKAKNQTGERKFQISRKLRHWLFLFERNRPEIVNTANAGFPAMLRVELARMLFLPVADSCFLLGWS